MAKLTPKQEMFCREYIVSLNATQAAIKAEYSEKTANRIANALLSKVDIQKRISELMEQRVERVEYDADYVLKRCIEIDQLDVTDIMDDNYNFKPLSQWPKQWRTSISAIDVQELMGSNDIPSAIKKIKWPDKTKNLELLGRHVNIQAFKERTEVEHSGKVETNQTLDLGKLSDEEIEQLRLITSTATRPD